MTIVNSFFTFFANFMSPIFYIFCSSGITLKSHNKTQFMPLTSLLPIRCFFAGKFMMISYFFGAFRVFSSVNFLYAQPIVFLRSYAPNAPGKLPCCTEITDFYTENVCNPVLFVCKKSRKQISPFSGFLTLLINL